jgi:hypothetical protein
MVDGDEEVVPFADLTEFTQEALGLRLVLRKSLNEMRQRDMDKFLKRYLEQPQGNSQYEDWGKSLRAALRADWIETFNVPGQSVLNGNEVDELRPVQVRWAGQIINRIFNLAFELPNA